MAFTISQLKRFVDNPVAKTVTAYSSEGEAVIVESVSNANYVASNLISGEFDRDAAIAHNKPLIRARNEMFYTALQTQLEGTQ